MFKYSYKMSGTDSGGQTWETSGDLEAPAQEFTGLLGQAMFDTINKLRKAPVGQGPYTIREFHMELVD